MQLYFYKAECGDAGRIRFLGDDGKYHNIFIDSGYRRTFKQILKPHIEEIGRNNEVLDLWVVSHIHDDHIGGVEQYIRQIKSGELKDIVKSWLYNSPRKNWENKASKLNAISSAVSIRQGDILTEYLKEMKKMPENEIIASKEPININGLNIYILSPSKEKLFAQTNKYDADKSLPLEKIEGESVSEATGSVFDDYHIQLNKFDLLTWEEDSSIENGSSISVLTEFDGNRILWLADSHPSIIVQSLKNLGYSEWNKINCNWVKVAHHGSKGNNSDELYSLINCSNYLFSANGTNKYRLPSKKSIARILRNQNRDKNSHYNLVFTYHNDVLKSIFKNEDDNIYKELRFDTQFLKHEKYLQIIF